MDGSKKVMESLDSLWFFDNVLVLPSFLHTKVHEDPVHEEEEEESKPEIQEAPRCPKCGEIAAGIEQHPITEVEFAKPTEKPEKRKRRRRRRRSKRKVLGELDLAKLASDSSFSEENVAPPDFETPHYSKMPPLNDGLAMKQHLKSWAYAVACTVK